MVVSRTTLVAIAEELNYLDWLISLVYLLA